MGMGFAIVGPGRFAESRIVPALARAQSADAVAVVSRDRTRAAAFAERHGIPAAYDDLGAALADPRVEAVWVATPHNLHREVAEAAARARKHVLCEKPLATTIEDARAMVAACRRAGVALGAGFHLRHHPLHRETQRIVARGELGAIVAAHGEWSLETAITAGAPWRRDPETSGGGIVTGTGIHVIDLLRFVLGDEVTAVSAMTDADTSPVAPVETRASVLLRFRGGTLATVRCVRPVHRPMNDLVLEGMHGSIAGRGTVDEASRGRLEAAGADPHLTGVPAGTDMYALQVQAFAQAARMGEDPDASGWDGLAVAVITAALYESARTGRTVQIESVR